MDDYIDKSLAQWAQIEPELSTAPAGIIGRISRLARVIEMRSDRVLEGGGVTRSEFEILSLLVRSDRPMTPGEISAQLLCSGASTTKRLKKLVASGMITRETNPTDGRGAFITLTDEARDKILPILRTVIEFEGSLVEALPAEARDLFTTQLRALLRSLERASSR